MTTMRFDIIISVMAASGNASVTGFFTEKPQEFDSKVNAVTWYNTHMRAIGRGVNEYFTLYPRSLGALVSASRGSAYGVVSTQTMIPKEMAAMSFITSQLVEVTTT